MSGGRHRKPEPDALPDVDLAGRLGAGPAVPVGRRARPAAPEQPQAHPQAHPPAYPPARPQARPQANQPAQQPSLQQHARGLPTPAGPVVPDPASPDTTIPRDEMLRRFRVARDTIRGKLEAYAATELR